ncbi:MAG: hypothetical protein ACE5OZ_02680 [Candidatus Heimdallarchaeota archaeon]
MRDSLPHIGLKDPWVPLQEKVRSEHLVVGLALLYILLQFYFVTLDHYIDFDTHAKWGAQYFEGSLYPASGRIPYKDYSFNEYPVLSVYGWIVAYGLCPQPDDYFLLSVFMLFPYWILAAIGGICLLPLLRQRGFTDRYALYIIAFYFFNPQNALDTARNHGSLGTFATVVIAYYLWTRQQDASSAAVLAIGFGLKLYPILLAPFLFIDARNLQRQLRFSGSLLLSLLVIHLPVLPFFSEYLAVLQSGDQRRGGMSLADWIADGGAMVGIDNSEGLVFLVYLIGMTLIVCGILPLTRVGGLEKFTLVYGANCLLEPYSGIGHLLFVMILLTPIVFSPGLSLPPWQRVVFGGYLLLGAVYGLPLLGSYKYWPKYYIVALTGIFLLVTLYILGTRGPSVSEPMVPATKLTPRA